MPLYSTFFLCISLIWTSSVETKHLAIREILRSRIINGQPAHEGQFPWQVGVLNVRSNLELHFCSGAIINEQWILTAAKCVEDADELGVYSGVIQIGALNRTESISTNYILHEDYDRETLKNDIGLIELDEPLTFNDNTQAIALASDYLEPGSEVTVTGWGQISDDDDSISQFLNYITVSTIDNSECGKIYESIGPGVVCTSPGHPVKSPCFGDGGAPVVVNASTGPIHAAIFSFINKYGCEEDYPSGNTRTAYYRDWIRNKTGV